MEIMQNKMKIKIWVVNLLLIIIIGIIVIMFLHNKKRIGVVNKEFKVNEFKENKGCYNGCYYQTYNYL